MTATPPVRVGIVTVSDRASRGEYQDLGGPAILDCLRDILSCPWEAVRAWARDNGVGTLNVAGPRESSAPGVYARAAEFLRRLLA